LYESLVISPLLYGAELWPLPVPQIIKKFWWFGFIEADCLLCMLM